ncbi:uncharacterized protein EDB93DRAFT_1147525 [Suillus bovinus]|uniref:uncharacterized protein n=1 Tax=Suillus bovinus TaxID=48563 RepID=UPI001B86095F|nr:uncharacterized protein EDB93DRAFT_1147525 [Suillus bovinus]KAG2147485.1 hypothetical protein EDB93DRAFT_1147525 [Suillus bovinus]
MSFVSCLSLPKIAVIVVLHPTSYGTLTCARRFIHNSGHPKEIILGNCQELCKMRCASRSLLRGSLGSLSTCGITII